ncbi:unnamed protein product [Brassica napus]|uniref:(rape) hypothetical protein n=1 Tax=Brassica napus TaxID=3708 RepID=A0A816MJ31_BRANA|nr:unnamed protein product [Brassica napus]
MDGLADGELESLLGMFNFDQCSPSKEGRPRDEMLGLSSLYSGHLHHHQNSVLSSDHNPLLVPDMLPISAIPGGILPTMRDSWDQNHLQDTATLKRKQVNVDNLHSTNSDYDVRRQELVKANKKQRVSLESPRVEETNTNWRDGKSISNSSNGDKSSVTSVKGKRRATKGTATDPQSLYARREVRESFSLSFFPPPTPFFLGPNSPLISSGGPVGLSRRSATPNLPARPIPLPVVLKPPHFLLAPPSLVLVGLCLDPPVVPLMLDRNSSFRVNSVATGEILSLRRDGSVLLVEVLLQRSSGGVCQVLLLMPARSHFGEFLTELSLAILLLHLKRREKINERLKTLQNLVPNGTKVDISTMLEEAVNYVKFLQLQIKLLSSDDLWMYAPLAYNGIDMGFHHNLLSRLT